MVTKVTHFLQNFTYSHVCKIHTWVNSCMCMQCYWFVLFLTKLCRYGLKGKVDVSVTVKERRKSLTTETTRVPLELKTGKMFRTQGTIQHRAQVRVLLLEEQYFVYFVLLQESIKLMSACNSINIV